MSSEPISGLDPTPISTSGSDYSVIERASANYRVSLGTSAGINKEIFGSGFKSVDVSGVDVILTNPCPNVIVVTGTGSANLILPPMNTNNSISSTINSFIVVFSAASASFSLAVNDLSASQVIQPGKIYTFYIISNGSVAGGFIEVDLSVVTSATSPLTISNTGVLSLNPLVDADISGSANIALSKINTSTLGGGYALEVFSGGTITLSNPSPNFVSVQGTSGTLRLPPMNQSNSLSKTNNSFLVLWCQTSGNVTVTTNTGASNYGTISGGKTWILFPIDSSSADGHFIVVDMTSVVQAVSPLSLNSAGTLSISQANTSTDGYLTSIDWNTFNNKQASLTIGNLTDSGTDGITITGGSSSVIGSGTSISQHVADTTHNGYLASTDWNTFNSKQASGNYMTALTGDVAASGPGSAAATIQSHAVSNSKLAQMAANTFKANNTGSPADAADITVANALSMLSLNQTATQVCFGNGASGITSSADFTYASHQLTLGGSGSNPALNIGDNAATSGGVLGRSTSATTFFSNSVAGDICFRQSDTAKNLLLGVGSSTSQVAISNTGITTNVLLTTASGAGVKFNNSTASYTPATLDYYETGTLSPLFVGPAVVQPSGIFVRNGKTMTFVMGGSGALTSTSATFFQGNSQIPTRLTPQIGCYAPLIVTDNGVTQTSPGMCYMDNSGNIYIYKNWASANFTGSGSCSFNTAIFTYKVT